MLLRGPSSLGDTLPCFCVAPQVGVMESHAFAWPLDLGCWTPTLLRGPLSWGHGVPTFCVAPRVWVMDSHALAWPLEQQLKQRA